MRRPVCLARLAFRLLSAAIVCACAHGGGSPVGTPVAERVTHSVAGRWDGEVRFPASPPSLMTVTLDSAGGTWQAEGSDPVRFVSVTRVRDSVVFRLPTSEQNAVFRGRLSADDRRLDGIIEVSGEGATFRAARTGTADAAAFIAEVRRVDASRRLAAGLMDTVAATPHADPDSAKLITSDIQLFWEAVDRASRDSLAPVLQREYLNRGTVGMRDFIPGRIFSAEDLAAAVRDRRAKYDSVRAANVDVARAEPAIRAAFRRLKAIYPDAVFPDVYFVIGRFNSGGTASKHGLLIGAEMYRDASGLPAIVAHELIHYQQHYDNPTLLEHSFLEGTADFLGEMISGSQINNAAHEYGLGHEHALWQEFKSHFDDRQFYPWMYGRPPDGRPNDLGYFIGYRIAEAYYNRTADKQHAIRDIISGGNDNVRELLAKSGYDP